MRKDDRFRMKCVPEVGSEAVRLHMILLALSLALAFLIWPTGVFANDSVAAMGAGGIELLKSDHIRMLEEVLEIAPHNVRVKYRFLNESDKDISTKVAFPLPFYDGITAANVPIGDPNTIFSTFKVWVDNKLVVTQSERKALLDGQDITDRLRKLGLSDKEIFHEVDDDQAPSDLWTKLEPFTREVGNWWDIEQTIYWDMTFPTRKETVVEHEYTPSTGGGYAVNSEDLKTDVGRLWRSFTGKSDGRENEDCLDETTKRAIEKRAKMALSKVGGDSFIAYYQKVKYILGTGRNWKGPIGEFTLRLEKENADQFVSVCFPGKPKKVGPMTYEFHEKDFVPPDKLVVYFYTVGEKLPGTP